MLVAEYIQNGYLIRVYRENGKRTVSLEVYRPTVDPTPLPLYLKKWSIEMKKERDDTNE